MPRPFHFLLLYLNFCCFLYALVSFLLVSFNAFSVLLGAFVGFFALLCVVGDLLLNGSSLFAKDMYALLFERDVMSCAINGMVIA